MFQKLLVTKHYSVQVCDLMSRPGLGRAEILVWSPTKLKKQEPRVVITALQKSQLLTLSDCERCEIQRKSCQKSFLTTESSR